MSFTPNDLRMIYPEFNDTTAYTDARIELFIEFGQDDIGADADHWGSPIRYKRALAALTAHYITLGTSTEFGDTSPAQAIASRRAGGVSVTHNLGSVKPHSSYSERLMSTNYGQEFLALRDKTFLPFMVVSPSSVDNRRY